MSRNYLIENFEAYFPWAAKKAVEWSITGPLEITVILEDDSRVIYDDTNKTLVNLNFTDESITELQWRREFSRRLIKWMVVRGMIQDDLADATGISRQSINKYATGSTTPSSFAIRAIARALECSVDELINF